MRAERLQPPGGAAGGMAGFGAAVAVSLGLHAAIFLALAGRAPEGMNADTEAISVEIVVEASPEAAAGPASVEARATPEEQAPDETAAIDFDAPAPPAGALALLASPPQIGEPAEAIPAFDAPPPPSASLSIFASPPEISVGPELPETVAAIPSPRPQPQAKRQAPRKKAQVEEKATKQPARKHARREKTEPAQKPSRETTASAGGGASAASRAAAGAAGEASYGRKLVAHLQRFKRYPDEAARRRISGATKLAVTIDRSGRLAGARIAGSSGHAVLDKEALAAARRAAPYPRPPQGVGGATVAIAVTLRFAPR